MVGILVHENNHFILSGPSPDEAAALALVRHWSIVQIGEAKSSRDTSPGVPQLLGELSARGVTIRRLIKSNFTVGVTRRMAAAQIEL